MEPQPGENNESKTENQQGKLEMKSRGKEGKNSSCSSSSSGAISQVSEKTDDCIEKPCVEQDSTTMASRSSPHHNCAICLEAINDESFIENCSHTFCFFCLKEWSKVKAECPLCKEKFERIIHNFQGDSSEEYVVPSSNNEPTNDRRGQALFMDGIMTTFMHPQEAHRSSMGSHTIRYLQNSLMIIYHELLTVSRVPSAFRQRVYEDNLWVKIPQDLRIQLVTDVFYRNDLTRTLRLIPWLVREIVSLFPDNNEMVTFLLKLIMNLVLTCNITSAEFRDRIEPYMGHNLSHFIHEFHGFAISLYDMETYDRLANYNPTVYRVFPSSSPNASILVGNMSNMSTLLNPDLDTRRDGQHGAGVLCRVIHAYSDQNGLQSSTPFVSNENMAGPSTSRCEVYQPEIIELSSDEEGPVEMITISSDEEDVTCVSSPIKSPLLSNSSVPNTFPPTEHVLESASTSSGIITATNVKFAVKEKGLIDQQGSSPTEESVNDGKKRMKNASKSTSVLIMPSLRKRKSRKASAHFQRKRHLSSSDSDEN